MDNLKILKASDTELNKDYLLVLSPSSVYKLKIVAKHEGSVTVQDERYTGVGSISLEAVLIEWDEEFYKEAKKLRVVKKENNISQKRESNLIISNISKKEGTMRTKNPKSKVVDKFLASVPEGQVPDWKDLTQKIAVELKEEGEDKLKRLTSLLRVRYWMFTKGGKTNSFKTQP